MKIKPNFLTKGSLPILILAGVILFVTLVFDIVRLTLFSDTPSGDAQWSRTTGVSSGESVFETIHKQYPTYEKEEQPLTVKRVRFSPHNYVLGNPESSVKIVIFNDNDCKKCRDNLVTLLDSLKPKLKDVLVVYKHMPKNRNKDSMSAMFGQIAIHKGVYEQFLAELDALEVTPKTTEAFLIILEKIGVSLKEQREIMTHDMLDILKEVQNDVAQAVKAGAYNSGSQPVIYVNGYQLGQRYLPEQDIFTYIERLSKGMDITERETDFRRKREAKESEEG